MQRPESRVIISMTIAVAAAAVELSVTKTWWIIYFLWMKNQNFNYKVRRENEENNKYKSMNEMKNELNENSNIF